MMVKFKALKEEQRIEVGKALLELIEKTGFVVYAGSFFLDDDVEIYRMSDIEASECIFEYLYSINSNLDDWMEEHDVELYWFNNNQGCIYTNEAMNEYLEDEFESMVDFAEKQNCISKFF